MRFQFILTSSLATLTNKNFAVRISMTVYTAAPILTQHKSTWCLFFYSAAANIHS